MHRAYFGQFSEKSQGAFGVVNYYVYVSVILTTSEKQGLTYLTETVYLSDDIFRTTQMSTWSFQSRLVLCIGHTLANFQRNRRWVFGVFHDYVYVFDILTTYEEHSLTYLTETLYLSDDIFSTTQMSTQSFQSLLVLCIGHTLSNFQRNRRWVF